VTNKTAATRYARALLDVALRERTDLHGIERELGEVVTLFAQYPSLQKVLLNPAVPTPRKRAAVAEIAARMSLMPILTKLLLLLAERDRLVLIPDLADAYRDRLLDYQNVVRAEVTTATPLATDRARAIEATVARATGRAVQLTAKVDPAIIGGVVTRIGSTVYDGSITRQLEKMKRRLVESA